MHVILKIQSPVYGFANLHGNIELKFQGQTIKKSTLGTMP